MFSPTASYYEGIKKEMREREKGRKKKETGASAVEHLVDRNYYFFCFIMFSSMPCMNIVSRTAKKRE
jgi:hypothetical protein